jgi:hypothetical protein
MNQGIAEKVMRKFEWLIQYIAEIHCCWPSGRQGKTLGIHRLVLAIGYQRAENTLLPTAYLPCTVLRSQCQPRILLAPFGRCSRTRRESLAGYFTSFINLTSSADFPAWHPRNCNVRCCWKYFTVCTWSYTYRDGLTTSYGFAGLLALRKKCGKGMDGIFAQSRTPQHARCSNRGVQPKFLRAMERLAGCKDGISM